MKKRQMIDVTLENFINCVFILIALMMLLTVIDNHNVTNYYNNLLLISFSVAITILNICDEIKANKQEGNYISVKIEHSYNACKVLAAICCATPIGLNVISDSSTWVNSHLEANRHWGICLITLFFYCYLAFWGYLYPIYMEFKYNQYGKNIKYEERN